MPPRDCHYCPHKFFEATLEDAYLECLRRGGCSGRGPRGGRTVAYLRKKCVRVARDDDDAQTDGECRDERASERARCSSDATGGRMDDGHAVASVAVRNLREGDTRSPQRPSCREKL